ncbi:MAG TPA: hypothetical protein VK629_05505 [Steroidobacteraceae bacterium]|nr:hypothetical protein [Steroidobacteraceae bacterium]
MKAFMMAMALMVFAGSAVAADKPNFSGIWKMDPAKSAYGQVPPPELFVRRIEHAEPMITIVEEQRGVGTTPETSRKMKTDGTPTVETINGAALKLTAVWEGSTLFAQTAIESFGVAFKDRMSLSADGKTLTSVVKIDSAQGAVELKIVFERQ